MPSWNELIDRYSKIDTVKAHIKNSTIELISRQLALFSKGTPLKISDPIITAIPILEQEDSLVCVKKLNNSRITMMPTPERQFESPLTNSGCKNASLVRNNLYQNLCQMIIMIDKISNVFDHDAGSIDIHIFEGLRDLDTQEKLFSDKKAEILEEMRKSSSNSTLAASILDDMAYAETTKWVSPIKNNIPVHSTGAAVDIRLWDNKKHEYLDVGLFGVIWGSNPNAMTFSEGISDQQKKNRLLLLMAATECGLVNYPYEHWHISSCDRYAAYWKGEKFATCNTASSKMIAETITHSSEKSESTYTYTDKRKDSFFYNSQNSLAEDKLTNQVHCFRSKL